MKISFAVVRLGSVPVFWLSLCWMVFGLLLPVSLAADLSNRERDAVSLSVNASESVILHTSHEAGYVAAGRPPRSNVANSPTYIQLTLSGNALNDYLVGQSNTAIRATVVPRNVVLVLDYAALSSVEVDGIQQQSLQRQPPYQLWQDTAAALEVAIRQMSVRDSLAIIGFDDVVQVLIPAQPVGDEANKQRLVATMYDVLQRLQLNRQQAMQAGRLHTGLFASIAKGLSELRRVSDKHHVNRLVVISDGAQHRGPNSTDPYAELARSVGAEGMAVTTVGLGLNFREDLLATMARYSGGSHVFVDDSEYLQMLLAEEISTMQDVIAQDIEVNLRFAEHVQPLRLLGRDGDVVGQSVQLRLNQLYAGQAAQVVVEVIHNNKTQLATGADYTIATAKIAYQQPHIQQLMLAEADVQVRYSQNPTEVAMNRNPSVLATVSTLLYNEMTKAAITQRDDGRLDAAQKTLLQANFMLQRAANNYRSQSLLDLATETEAELNGYLNTNDMDWRRTRKILTEQQIRLDNQLPTTTKSYGYELNTEADMLSDQEAKPDITPGINNKSAY